MKVLLGEKLGLQNLSSKVEVFPYLTQGITVKEFLLLKFCNRLTSFIFRLYGSCPKSVLSRRFDDMRLSIFFGFIWKRFWKTIRMLWKVLILHYFSYMHMLWLMSTGLWKTSERSTTSCDGLKDYLSSRLYLESWKTWYQNIR